MLRAMVTAPRDGMLIQLANSDLSDVQLGYWGQLVDGGMGWLDIDGLDSSPDGSFAGWMPFDADLARLMKERHGYHYRVAGVVIAEPGLAGAAVARALDHAAEIARRTRPRAVF